MKSIEFVEPNFRCSVSRGRSRQTTVLDYAATAGELRSALEELGYAVHSIEPYDFQEWRERAQRHTRKAIEEFEGTGEVRFNASFWGELKHHLFRLFHHQCAYCEVTVTDVDPGSVEHYRPKGRVEEDPNHPGYFWLAYDERNWLPACPNCNEVAKRSHFPIAANSTRAYKPGDEGLELPMLLTPYDVVRDRDFEFFFSKRGVCCLIKGRNDRAAATIAVCGLDRVELSMSRGKGWLRAQQDFIALILTLGSCEEARKIFDANVDRREFSSACRVAVSLLCS